MNYVNCHSWPFPFTVAGVHGERQWQQAERGILLEGVLFLGSLKSNSTCSRLFHLLACPNFQEPSLGTQSEWVSVYPFLGRWISIKNTLPKFVLWLRKLLTDAPFCLRVVRLGLASNLLEPILKQAYTKAGASPKHSCGALEWGLLRMLVNSFHWWNLSTRGQITCTTLLVWQEAVGMASNASFFGFGACTCHHLPGLPRMSSLQSSCGVTGLIILHSRPLQCSVRLAEVIPAKWA